MILVVAEAAPRRPQSRDAGKRSPPRSRWPETEPIVVAVPGAAPAAVATELAGAAVAEVVTLEHPALEPYTADGYVMALQDAIAQLPPSLVLLPHTYQTRDFAPKLAARLNRAIVTDVTAVKTVNGARAFVASRCFRAS